MSAVVSDTSPFRALAHLGRIELLRDLFEAVAVPPAVAEELRCPPIGLPLVEIRALEFVSMLAPRDLDRVRALGRTLDLGESEALVLALELGISVVLMDEAASRSEAKRLGLRPIGVLGILIRAKNLGLIDLVAPSLARLEDEIDFYVSVRSRAEVLRMAGEA